MRDDLLQVAPLMKVPLVKGRASSLPSPTTLDHLTEGTAAALQAEKQSTPQPPPLTNLPMLPDDADPEPQAPALQQPLEPPDQVLLTPSLNDAWSAFRHL